MSREALVLLVCCCDFRDGAERLIPSKSLRNAVIRAFPGLFRILRMCAPRRAAAVVRPRGREKSADRRRRILISRLLIIRASVPRRKSPFPAYFKGFPAVSPLIPPYPAFLKYPVSPHLVKNGNVKPVTSINQKLNYGGLIEDYPVGYIFTVENDNEDVVLNAAPVPGKDDPKPDPKPEPKPEPEPEAPTYTLTVKGGTFTYNGSEAMTSASVPVDAEVKVTLNQSAVPEGMVFDLWAMDEASLLGNPAVVYNQESFTIPAGSVAKGSTVTVEAQYRDATIESEPSILGTAAIIGVAGAGTAVIVWQGYRIGMELYEKYFQPTPEETAAEQPAPEAPAAAAS